MSLPLDGVRVLSLEQAAALPFATRHLADLGAEVIRVQSHKRPVGVLLEASLYRNKRLVCLDLAADGGPDLFRRLAAHCDIVAHNFTPRVMRSFALTFEDLAELRDDLIYCEVTGFGTVGAWAERPLFGPGAEAVSGHNLLIGEPGAGPGRPGTITYADNVCGLNVLFALLAALERRERVDGPQHLDLSLYETAVAQLGPALVARQTGDAAPTRQGHRDAAFAWQGFVEGVDGTVAVSVGTDQMAGFDGDALADRPVAEIVEVLQARDIASARLADVADVLADGQRWHRGCFGMLDDLPCAGPVWGTTLGALQPWLSDHPGADNRAVFSEVAGVGETELDSLHGTDVLGELAVSFGARPVRNSEQDVARGLLTRVDPDPGGWQAFAEDVPVVAAAMTAGNLCAPSHRLLELPGGPAVAQVGRLFRLAGWDVVKVEPSAGDPARAQPSRWGAATGATFAFLNAGKRSVCSRGEDLARLASTADVVIGDLRGVTLAELGTSREALSPSRVLASITPFGLEADAVASDFTLQAASGFMSLTGEYAQPPQPLPPEAANLVGGLGHASAVFAACIAGAGFRFLDLAVVDGLTGFIHLQAARYAATGEVPRREGRVKHALRMVQTQDGYLYCAPGAVMSVDMRGVAELLGEPRLAEERFQTAEGRMSHWAEYVDLMDAGFATRTATEWFDAAARLRLTFALVQDLGDLLDCPQLAARDSLVPLAALGSDGVRIPVVRFADAALDSLTSPAVGEHTMDVFDQWLAGGEA